MDPAAFYSERINHFDNERRLFTEYINLIHISPKEQHMLEWENRQIKNEINDAILQRDESQAELENLNIELERKRKEFEEVKNTQGAKTKQIELLSELSQPVEHDFTYTFRDKYANSKSNVTGNKVKVLNELDYKKQDHNSIHTKKYRSGEVITMEKNLAELSSSIESLANRIIERATLREDDLKVEQDDLVEQLIKYRKETHGLILSVNKSEIQSFSSVADLLRLRLNIMIAQREEMEEIIELEKDKENFSKREKNTRNQLLDETKAAKKNLEIELKDTSKEFKKQLDLIEKRITKALVLEKKVELKSKHMEAHSGNALEEHLKTSKRRYLKLKRRHALEMEGYCHEAKFLRMRMKQIEKQISGSVTPRSK